MIYIYIYVCVYVCMYVIYIYIYIYIPTDIPHGIATFSQAEEALEKDPKCFLAAWEGAIAAKHIGALASSPGMFGLDLGVWNERGGIYIYIYNMVIYVCMSCM